jgi:outer membrane receptor for ferrienterochelin and colicin
MKSLRIASFSLLIFTTGLAGAAWAATVRGVVHDPQHHPVPGATVTLTAAHSAWRITTVSDTNGAFEFPGIAPGDYLVRVTIEGFAPWNEAVSVTSNAEPVLHAQLALATLRQSLTVSAAGTIESVRSATPSTLVSREDIAQTPGADRTNSLQIITDFVPGAYVVHDQLHVRGGHQVNWLVDGVPVPNSNIASNVGPQIDPKDMDYLEVQRGGYNAAVGDRTYGVFNVVPRTGFERDNEAELVVSGGSDRQTNDQFSIGGHTERFAYYLSATGDRSDLGLAPPVADVLHDGENGLGGFGTLVFNRDESNQFRLVTSVRRDRYQIPNTPDDQVAGISDADHESDAFVTFSWVRTFGSHAVLTASPFVHRNTAAYLGGAQDDPQTTDRRASTYAGGQVTLDESVGPHQIRAGLYGFHQRDDQAFTVFSPTDASENVNADERPSGHLLSGFVQDDYAVRPWLTLDAGLRVSHFAGGVTEHAVSPRLGGWAQLPAIHWTVRGSWGRYYQEPPLVTASGPALAFVTSQDLGFIPLYGERDTETQLGVTIPVQGWAVDVDAYHTRATNFFDHNSVGNSNVFFPLTIDGALIRGATVTVQSPRGWTTGELHVAYAYQIATGNGAINGGLTDFEPGDETFYLDHDQRHTLSVGGRVNIEGGTFVSANASLGSGFLDGAGPAHLPAHGTVDAAVGHTFSTTLTISLSALNLTNERVLVDNSETFGGTHWTTPRQVYVSLRYGFHY